MGLPIDTFTREDQIKRIEREFIRVQRGKLVRRNISMDTRPCSYLSLREETTVDSRSESLKT